MEEEVVAWAFDAVAWRLWGHKAHGGWGSGKKTWRLNYPTSEEAAAAAVEDPAEAKAVAQAVEATVAERWLARQGSSAFVGVTWHKTKRQWKAQIWHNSKNLLLGLLGYFVHIRCTSFKA